MPEALATLFIAVLLISGLVLLPNAYRYTVVLVDTVRTAEKAIVWNLLFPARFATWALVEDKTFVVGDELLVVSHASTVAAVAKALFASKLTFNSHVPAGSVAVAICALLVVRV